MPRHEHRGYAAAESAVETAQIGMEGPAHCVGMRHKREEGVESDGVGWSNLPVNQDKHRADRTAIENKTKKEEQEEGPG